MGRSSALARALSLRYRRAMLSVLIETRNDEDGLARTLASLVGAAVDGTVREVIVCDRGSEDHTRSVADHAGCRILAGAGLAAGIAQAKADWLLVLEPGARMVDGWTECVADHVAISDRAARFTPVIAGWRERLARLLGRREAFADGLVVTRRQAAEAATLRGIRTRRLSGGIAPATGQ